MILDAGIPGAVYVWQDLSTSQTLNVNQSGNYWVQVSLANCEVRDSIQIDFQSLPTISLGNDTTLCEGESLLLDASYNGATYLWQDQSTDAILAVVQPGTYWFIASIGECQERDTVDVLYQSLPIIDLGNDTTLCAGEQLTLHVDYPGAMYDWQDHSTQMDFLVTESGEYFVNVRSGLCVGTDTIQVAYLELSSIHIGEDTTLCDGQSLTLQVNAPGAQYEWQDQSILQTYLVSQPGHYWVQVSLAACTTSDTIVIDFAAPVVVDLGADTILCEGQSLILDAQSLGATYDWQDQSTMSIHTVTQNGSYYVTLNVQGCMNSDTIQIDYVELPEDILGQDTSLCQGAMLLLDATTQGAQFVWQDQTTEPTNLITQPGIYEVTLTIGQCSRSDSILIEYDTPIHINLGADRTICEGENILLAPFIQQVAEYLWQDNSTTMSYEVTESGLYWVQVHDDCSTDTDSLEVTVNPCSCKLFVSNVFSPNGDGINDTFIPQASCVFITYHLTIYDRYGGLLFESNDAGEEWDGTVKSKDAQSGVYVYVLTYALEDGVTKHLYGDVMILR